MHGQAPALSAASRVSCIDSGRRGRVSPWAANRLPARVPPRRLAHSLSPSLSLSLSLSPSLSLSLTHTRGGAQEIEERLRRISELSGTPLHRLAADPVRAAAATRTGVRWRARR